MTGTINEQLIRAYNQRDDAAFCAAMDSLTNLIVSLNKRNHESDNQLSWLCGWCKELTGVENNKVINSEGWPNKCVEVVAQAVDMHCTNLEREIRERGLNKGIGNQLREAVANNHQVPDEGHEIAAILRRAIVAEEKLAEANKLVGDLAEAVVQLQANLRGAPLPKGE